MVQAWPIKIFYFPDHSDWFGDGRVSQTKLMTVSLRIFAGAIVRKVLLEGAVTCRATLGAAGLPRPLQRVSLSEDKAKTEGSRTEN